MSETVTATVNLTDEETALKAQFERWLLTTAEPFDEWIFDGENFVVYAAGREPEIYEPALVRVLVGGA